MALYKHFIDCRLYCKENVYLVYVVRWFIFNAAKALYCICVSTDFVCSCGFDFPYFLLIHYFLGNYLRTFLVHFMHIYPFPGRMA